MTAAQEQPLTHTSKQLLVATDLDGTLLDHHSYQWQGAQESIQKLKSLNIPIIINTSKTMEEVLVLQQQMGINDPFIVENGSAIYVHDNDDRFAQAGMERQNSFSRKVLGCERAEITHTLTNLRKKHDWKWQGYSDIDLQGVVDLTGLDPAQARLSLTRQYSEPLVWQDTKKNLELFKKAVAAQGLHILKGGRFTHVLGQTNKGQALTWLSQRFQSPSAVTIVLGDSHNDLDMLAVADFPVLIKSPSHDFPAFDHPQLTRSTLYGPEGWNEIMLHLLGTVLESKK